MVQGSCDGEIGKGRLWAWAGKIFPEPSRAVRSWLETGCFRCLPRNPDSCQGFPRGRCRRGGRKRFASSASDRRAICVVRRSSSEVRTKTLTVVRVLSQQGPSQHRDRRTGCDSRWCRQALLSGPELPSYRKLRPETSVSVPSMPSCQVLRYEASRRGGWRRARSASGPRKHRHRRETTPGSVFAD